MSSLMSMIMSDGGGFQWVGPDRGRDRGWWGGGVDVTHSRVACPLRCGILRRRYSVINTYCGWQWNGINWIAH